MNRRMVLSAALGKSRKAKKVYRPKAPTLGLAPYSGEWGTVQALHLLRRGMFGPNAEQIQWAVETGMEGVVAKLFEELPVPEPPVNTAFTADPWVPVGETWISAPYEENLESEQIDYRTRSLKSWTMKLILEEGISIREKMTLFWHNHFPLNEVQDPRFLYRYIALLRSSALGNFRELTKAVTIEPAMLIYLNGSQNIKFAPNENFGRELLELFSIGKGPQVAPGDYTNFTELDVREVARALTGWSHFGHGFSSETPDGSFGSRFTPEMHDTRTKTLSARFGNHEIINQDEEEYSYLIDTIFQQPEVARFICRKLYRWFVYYRIDAEVETNIIEPLAQLLIDSNFEVKPVLQALLSSEHFFSPANIGAMIKSPLEFVASLVKPLKLNMAAEPDQLYDSCYALYDSSMRQKQELYFFPEVAGWRAYYLAPQYYRGWLSSSTLPLRTQFVKGLLFDHIYPREGNGPGMRVNVLELVKNLSSPMNPNAVINDLATLLFSFPLQENQLKLLKEVLIPGLPDFEWTVEYGAYAENPADTELAGAVDAKLRALLSTMLSMGEFQLA